MSYAKRDVWECDVCHKQATMPVYAFHLRGNDYPADDWYYLSHAKAPATHFQNHFCSMECLVVGLRKFVPEED